MNLLGATFTYIDQSANVIKAAEKMAIKNIGHAAAKIRKVALESIKSEPGPSPVGTPPHTHTQRITKKGKIRKGQFPRAIVFDVDKSATDAVIGFRESVVGLSAHAHEFGDTFHGDHFQKRPTMAPALDQVAPMFGDSFAGALGE